MNINDLLTDLQYYCNRKNAIWSYRTIKQIIEHAARIEYLTCKTGFTKECANDIDKIMISTGMKEKIQQLYRLDKERLRNEK